MKKNMKLRKDTSLDKIKQHGFKVIENDGKVRFFKKVYLANADDDRVCYEIQEDRILRITRLDGELDDTIYNLIMDNLLEVE